MKTESHQNIESLALGFINYTHRNIFLTGGAGTGKTTFLKSLKKNTYKKLVIAAPTGVAAINAGGITLHSLFGLPSRPLTEETIKKIRLNAKVKAILREIELLIIDEASMLRADVLDAIDFLLREARQSFEPLGGLQLVLIGDLFQLPPFQSQHDTENLMDIYSSLYFIDSKSFNSMNVIVLELSKTYRQSDPVFINLLNSIRNGILTSFELDKINGLVCEDYSKRNSIFLTTHNQFASNLNEQKLHNLPGIVYTFKGSVNGDFPIDQFPVDEILELKLGCRVMVIKNDNSLNPKFYNGKIGDITLINNQKIVVKFENNETIEFEREIWSNVGYTLGNDENLIQEVVLGTYTQFPLQLAYAITIHKSQGLTFDEAIIDVAEAFAPGQTYVAFSRVKSMEGICLKSELTPSAFIRPHIIDKMYSKIYDTSVLEKELDKGKKVYFKNFLLKVFNFNDLEFVIDQTNEDYFSIIYANLIKLKKHASIFSSEITESIDKSESLNFELLASRVTKAENYFVKQIKAIVEPINKYINENKNYYIQRDFINKLKHQVKLFKEKAKSITLSKDLIDGISNVKISTNDSDTSEKLIKKASRKLLPNPNTISLEAEILQLFLQGKSVSEIALLKGLGGSAVENHLAYYIPTGEVKISEIISQHILDEILPRVKHIKSPTIAQLRPLTASILTMGQIKALCVYLEMELS